MNVTELYNKKEELAEQVHNSWMERKRKDGFHSPIECKFLPLPNFKQYQKYCDKCHPDMYPYNELMEKVKDYDRGIVIVVLDAISKLESKGN